MAKRPIFISDVKPGIWFEKQSIDFEWFPGFSVKQKQRSIQALHKSATEKNRDLQILEISSKSIQPIGIELSAFNLMIETKNNIKFSVETAFQASKVFENGGPFLDLYEKSSREAKKDRRLKESGNLVRFSYFNREFSLNPKTFFYNWLYINTLSQQKKLSEEILEYNAFTDIEFNPEKSINCQAEAAAIYVSLCKSDLINDALSSVESFEKIVYDLKSEEDKLNKNISENKSEQLRLM